MSTKSNTTLKLRHFRPLFSDCRTLSDLQRDYEYAHGSESCLFDDIDATIKDLLAECHRLTPEIRNLQKLRNRIGKNIQRIEYLKHKILGEQQNGSKKTGI